MNAGPFVPLEELLRERRDHEIEIWALSAMIDELEAELGEAGAPRPIRGGPPPEWDRWIMELPDTVFADCLGSKEGEDRQPREQPKAAATSTEPLAARESGWKAAPLATGRR